MRREYSPPQLNATSILAGSGDGEAISSPRHITCLIPRHYGRDASAGMEGIAFATGLEPCMDGSRGARAFRGILALFRLRPCSEGQVPLVRTQPRMRLICSTGAARPDEVSAGPRSGRLSSGQAEAGTGGAHAVALVPIVAPEAHLRCDGTRSLAPRSEAGVRQGSAICSSALPNGRYVRYLPSSRHAGGVPCIGGRAFGATHLPSRWGMVPLSWSGGLRRLELGSSP